MKIKQVKVASGACIAILACIICAYAFFRQNEPDISEFYSVINGYPTPILIDDPKNVQAAEIGEIRNCILKLYGVLDCFAAISYGADSPFDSSYSEPTADIRLTLSEDGIFSVELEQAVIEIIKSHIPDIKDGNIAITIITSKTDDYTQIVAEETPEMPDDFAFRIDFGIYGRNNIDTYNNTFTKDLVIAGSETIEFIIPADMMQFLYEMFIALNIPGCPDDINAFAMSSMGDTRMHRHPADNYALTYTCSGETRTITCNDEGPWDGDAGPPASRDRLAAFVKMVADYIYSTDEYKAIPSAEGGYD